MNLELLNLLHDDYDHPWPNEDKLTKKHRLKMLQLIHHEILNHEVTNLEINEWYKCAVELAEKLTRFQRKGYLASHDKSLARFNQLILKEKTCL